MGAEISGNNSRFYFHVLSRSPTWDERQRRQRKSGWQQVMTPPTNTPLRLEKTTNCFTVSISLSLPSLPPSLTSSLSLSLCSVCCSLSPHLISRSVDSVISLVCVYACFDTDNSGYCLSFCLSDAGRRDADHSVTRPQIVLSPPSAACLQPGEPSTSGLIWSHL